MSHVLAIDLGTGGPKVAIVSLEGEIVGHEFEPTTLLLGEGGKAEQDPEEWWSAISTAAIRLLDRDLVPVGDIDAVSVTAQWSGTVPVDADGKALMNALTWMDSRGAAFIKDVTSGTVKLQGYDVRRLRSWVQRSGGVPSHSGKDPTAHILWIKHRAPEVYAATHTFLEPADYLNLRLSGRTVSSHDCITAHWVTDNRDRDDIHYDDELIRFSDLDRSTLPELVPSASVIGTITGEVAGAWGLSPSTKVVTATADVHSAVVGSGALARLPGAPLHRHVVVAELPRSVEEDRPVQQPGGDPLRAARPLLHRQRARDRRRVHRPPDRPRALRRRRPRNATSRRPLRRGRGVGRDACLPVRTASSTRRGSTASAPPSTTTRSAAAGTT